MLNLNTSGAPAIRHILPMARKVSIVVEQILKLQCSLSCYHATPDGIFEAGQEPLVLAGRFVLPTRSFRKPGGELLEEVNTFISVLRMFGIRPLVSRNLDSRPNFQIAFDVSSLFFKAYCTVNATRFGKTLALQIWAEHLDPQVSAKVKMIDGILADLFDKCRASSTPPRNLSTGTDLHAEGQKIC